MIATFIKIYELLTPAQRKNATALLGLTVIDMGLETLGVGLVIPVITLLTQRDHIVRHPHVSPVLAWLGQPSQRTLIVGAMLGLTGIFLAKNMFLAFFAWWQARFAFGVQAQLSQRLLTLYLRQPYVFHLRRNSAQLIHNAINEVRSFAHEAILPAIVVITESLVLLGITGLLLTIEPLGVLIIVFVFGGATWAFLYSTRAHIADLGQAHEHHQSLRLQHVMQGLSGAKDIKLFGRENDFLTRYHVHNSQSARMEQLLETLQQIPRLWVELLTVASLAALVLTMLVQGRDIHGVMPTAGLFAAAAFRLMPSINRMHIATQSLRYSVPVIENLHQELKLPVPEPTLTNSHAVSSFHNEIRVCGASYTYPGSPKSALTDVSIDIQRGASVGLIGPSGSGKSTLVDVVLGLLSPDSGRVLVDGKDIQGALRQWQDQIGYVPQSIYLTDDTVRRNVAFGLPDEQIDEAAVRRAVEAAQLKDFVSSLPEGLETYVGERGIKLSGGQRQRIGIARALYHDPAVLVLDEATNSLDVIAERSVMKAVTAFQRKKTLVIVAHRLSTVESCDRIYRLEQGKIGEELARAESLRVPQVV